MLAGRSKRTIRRWRAANLIRTMRPGRIAWYFAEDVLKAEKAMEELLTHPEFGKQHAEP